nr:Ty3/gypsy retrotransposon protein [Tanacetum cinerariifolium]
MESLVMVALLDFTKPFDVTTDASGQAIGAVLSQSDRPINFFSKKLCARMQEASTCIRELYAITEAIKKWRQYLLRRKFRVFTDQHSLKHLLTQRVQTPDQHKWITKLLGYDFEIHYKPRKDNRVADGLSCIDTPISLAISTPTTTWLHALRKYFATDSVNKTVWKKISDQPQQNEFHSFPLGGHSGIEATIKRLTTVFYWLNVGDDVSNFIKSCSICQQVKAPNHKAYGLLHHCQSRLVFGMTYQWTSSRIFPHRMPLVEVPLWPTDHLHISTPEVVLDRKTTQMNKVKVLIKWLGHDISEATWEDEEHIRFQFLEFSLNLEDEVISHEGGNDRSITGHISPATYKVNPSVVQRPKRQSKRPARYSD